MLYSHVMSQHYRERLGCSFAPYGDRASYFHFFSRCAAHSDQFNAVLAAIPSYYMPCFMWPSESIPSLVWKIYLLFQYSGK